MSLIVLLRGINVGGHRAFRPKLLAQQLREFDVVNIGAAGTFVVRKPTSRTRFEKALRATISPTTHAVICEGRDLLQLDAEHSLTEPSSTSGNVRFVSFLTKRSRTAVATPLELPYDGEWFVRVTALTGRLAVGEYRRHMKTIGYLGQLDSVFGSVVTTRSTGTVAAILRLLRGEVDAPRKTTRTLGMRSSRTPSR